MRRHYADDCGVGVLCGSKKATNPAGVGPVAQWLEPAAHNRLVGGSSSLRAHHSVCRFWRVLSRLGKAPSFPALSWRLAPNVWRDQPFSGLCLPNFRPFVSVGLVSCPNVCGSDGRCIGRDASEMLGGEESFLGCPGIRQVRQSRKPLSRELHWMVAGEDGVDQLGRRKARGRMRLTSDGSTRLAVAMSVRVLIGCRRSAAEDSDATAGPDRPEPDRERGFADGRW